MPTIPAFHGVVIRMFHGDHAPPHLHATYGDFEGIIGFDPVSTVTGRLPPRIEKMVIDWVAFHRQELESNWECGQQHQPLRRIDPLP